MSGKTKEEALPYSAGDNSHDDFDLASLRAPSSRHRIREQFAFGGMGFWVLFGSCSRYLWRSVISGPSPAIT
jgi:hypothetical protein